MFTKTQAHKIKNCDKKKNEIVERLKNNTKKRTKKKASNICAAQAAAQNEKENKNGYTQRMQSLLKQTRRRG